MRLFYFYIKYCIKRADNGKMMGQGGKAFGAITNQNIHDALTAQGVEVDRRAIELEKPIKSEGEHEVAIKVHPQVEATLKVVVKENA